MTGLLHMRGHWKGGSTSDTLLDSTDTCNNFFSSIQGRFKGVPMECPPRFAETGCLTMCGCQGHEIIPGGLLSPKSYVDVPATP